MSGTPEALPTCCPCSATLPLVPQTHTGSCRPELHQGPCTPLQPPHQAQKTDRRATVAPGNPRGACQARTSANRGKAPGPGWLQHNAQPLTPPRRIPEERPLCPGFPSAEQSPLRPGQAAPSLPCTCPGGPARLPRGHSGPTGRQAKGQAHSTSTLPGTAIQRVEPQAWRNQPCPGGSGRARAGPLSLSCPWGQSQQNQRLELPCLPLRGPTSTLPRPLSLRRPGARAVPMPAQSWPSPEQVAGW